MVNQKKDLIAVDIGATNLRIALGDNQGNLFKKIKVKTPKSGGKKAVAERIVAVVKDYQRSNTISALGIGCMGPLDLGKEATIKPINHPLKTISLKPIASALKLPTYVLNDCNAGALGEKRFGAGKNFENIIYITFSTGLGAGAIVNDCLVLGKGGNGMEAGHMVVDPAGRMKCDCGKKGHWEAYSSAQDQPKFFKKWKKENNIVESNKLQGKISSKQIFQKAREGDRTALEFMNELGRINAIGIANLVNVFDTSLITLGGAVALHDGDLLMKYMKKHLVKFNYLSIPPIKITSLGDEIVLLGALAAADDKLGYRLK